MQLRKVLLLFIMVLGVAVAQPKVSWNPKISKVWDPNRVMEPKHKVALNLKIMRGPIKAYLIVIKDFSAQSIGTVWAAKAAEKKAADPGYYPALVVLKLAEAKFHIGDADPSRQSIVVLVTTLREGPATRWAMTISEATAKNLNIAAVSKKSFEAFGMAIAPQTKHQPANSEKLAEGLQKAFNVLFETVKK